MKIAIVTDGNNTLGMGHIYQSVTLAFFLAEARTVTKIFFLTKSDEKVTALIKQRGFEVNRYDTDEEIFTALQASAPDRIIFDKLDVSPVLAEKIKKELKGKLIIFTNLTEANKWADIAVLADIGSDFKNIYSKDDATGRIEFFGPKYWILRPEFYLYNQQPKQDSVQPEKLLLIFGGSDPSNISSAVLAVLLKMDHRYDITLVLGASFGNRGEIDALLRGNTSSNSKVTVAVNATDIAAMMYGSDVVLASPGLSFF
jgi:spore coat polysaccharide biosynthesis predicted glycosyltransferase SpsG